MSEAWDYLRGLGGTSISKQEKAFELAAEESMMKMPLLDPSEAADYQWEDPETKAPVLTLVDHEDHWGDDTRSAIETVHTRYQPQPVE